MRKLVGVIGELALTLGVIVALFVAYQFFWTGVRTDQAQERLRQQLSHSGSAGRSPDAEPPAPGYPLASLRIPRLGADWSWVVVEGVRQADLRRGPGHYPGTALPGQVGNFAVAGHRATHGEPFARLDRLRPGDRIVVETEQRRFVYRVRDSEIVSPEVSDVVLPVPNQPGAAPTSALLTLTTCHPRWGSGERLIVYAALERS